MNKVKIQLLGLVLFLLVMQALGIGLTYIIGLVSGCGDNYETIMSHPDMMPLSLIFSNVLLCATLFLFRWYQPRAFCLQGLRIKDFIAVCALMLPVIFIVNLLIESFDTEDLTKDAVMQLAYHPLGIVAIVLIGPFAEELVFRMECMKILLNFDDRPLMAIIWSSLIFGIVHINTPQILGGALVGLVLGWLYWKSKSIWVSFTAHSFNNLLGLVFIWIYGNKDVTLQEISGNAKTLWLLVFFSIIVGSWLFLYLNKRFTLKNQVLKGEG